MDKWAAAAAAAIGSSEVSDVTPGTDALVCSEAVDPCPPGVFPEPVAPCPLLAGGGGGGGGWRAVPPVIAGWPVGVLGWWNLRGKSFDIKAAADAA